MHWVSSNIVNVILDLQQHRRIKNATVGVVQVVRMSQDRLPVAVGTAFAQLVEIPCREVAIIVVHWIASPRTVEEVHVVQTTLTHLLWKLPRYFSEAA